MATARLFHRHAFCKPCSHGCPRTTVKQFENAISSIPDFCGAASIQEACLVAMICLIASCDDIPEGAIAVTHKVQEQGGRHIRRRCEQFLNLSHSRTIVQHIVGKSKSSSSPQPPSTPPRPSVQIKDDLASRMDLIALDSPFIVDPPAAPSATQEDFDFKETWNKLAKANMRGWCEAPVEAVVRKLQDTDKKIRLLPADQGPFTGDLKVVIHGNHESNLDAIALLRLKEGEDDSCMWHMRCEDSLLKDAVGATLKGI
ncbi:hypothetical protein EIP86_000470 [Pleurotus ostreatoroseus]|nr:hypothetical protein EIP86_000470 [Pleurotus ostreatoroseus]